MSTFSATLESSTSRVKPIKRSRRSHLLTFLFTFLQPATLALLSNLKESPMKVAYKKHPYMPSNHAHTPSLPKPSLPTPSPSSQQLDQIFIDVLVQAYSCRQHKSRNFLPHPFFSNSTHLYHEARRRHIHDGGRQIRHLHRSTAIARPPTKKSPLSREECMSMLDFYREPFSTQAMFPSSEPQPLPSAFYAPVAREVQTVQGEHSCRRAGTQKSPLPPDLEYRHLGHPALVVGEVEGISKVGEDLTSTLAMGAPAPKLSPSTDPKTLEHKVPAIDNLLKVLQSSKCTHEEAFEAYRALPSPGVSYLSSQVQRLLFRRLSVVQRKDKLSAMRFLSVVDDIKACNLPLERAEWNSAIAFCGQCFMRVTAGEMESALRTWKEMEQEAGVRGGGVTFNILFDMAAKAGKFVLAEMILKEMEIRKLPVNRYARVAFIYHHGLRGDGNSVRRAYRDFVNAGEIVDTVVMNCVIASLIRAGEPAAAEQVYERMKQMLAKHTGECLPNLHWKEVRDLGRLLNRVARRFRDQPRELQKVQDKQSLAPDLHTYAILVEHHATQTGELHRIASLLYEMQNLGIPIHGRIFLKIFKGFSYHGGIRYSTWTKSRLENVWNSLLDVLDQENDVKITKWMITWIVRAFERCAGRQRTLEIWEELIKRWDSPGGDIDIVINVLRDILKVDEHQ